LPWLAAVFLPVKTGSSHLKKWNASATLPGSTLPCAAAILEFQPRAVERCSRSILNESKEKYMQRKASAVWKGTLKEGKGTITTESGVLKDTAYSFHTRFEDGKGTNPEELIAAAHAGCFTMALSGQLTKANLTPESLETTAELTLEMLPTGPTVTKIHLTTRAKVPGASKEAFATAANEAKVNCPISRLLKAAEITLDAQLA
jgi:lipoyl-dependent peroxiredoxin